MISHPAKAQAVAAELKVWKSWRSQRTSQSKPTSSTFPENQVGKQGGKDPLKQRAAQGLMQTLEPTVRASQPCLNTQAQVANIMVLPLNFSLHPFPSFLSSGPFLGR